MKQSERQTDRQSNETSAQLERLVPVASEDGETRISMQPNR